MLVIAIDPGRQKVGLALVDEAGAVVDRVIVAPDQVEPTLMCWKASRGPVHAVIGDGTASSGAGGVRAIAERVFGQGSVDRVDESGSTLEARRLWLDLNPPRGLWRLIPSGLRAPDGPIDDLAAVVLARRWLAGPREKS